jgi:hypothetical protein
VEKHVRNVSSLALPLSKESEHLPASVSIPGVDACRYMGFGGVMRASRGEAIGWGVLMALCIALAPFVIWAYPGEGMRCWRVGCGCEEDETCWLRPEGVREGIWRRMRLLLLLLPGDRSNDGDGRAGAGCGVGVPAGESDGDSNELMSMVCDVYQLLSDVVLRCDAD